ncbi:MAG: ferrous iron transport protein A [Hungatella sp.]|nr:ferrous iron transport protein A [Hungatella sp.]
MPLAMAMKGETRIITGFRGKEEMKRHLKDLGFIKGEQVHVAGENAGGMICVVKGVRVALNRGLADKIIVAD